MLCSETTCQENKKIRLFYIRLEERFAKVLGNKKHFRVCFKTSAQFQLLFQKTWCPVKGCTGNTVVITHTERSLLDGFPLNLCALHSNTSGMFDALTEVQQLVGFATNGQCALSRKAQ